jgi:vacuolar-type H+-ATPase subunit D/Vma8
MAIDSPLLRQLRQREQENLRIAAELKQKRLQIEAEIDEIERETEELRSETEELRAGNAKLLSMFCEVMASKSPPTDTMTDALVTPTR